ncbi:MAG: hypothetical protein MZV49_24920 [Rhodopseudomonas palustris]|nr:hypothetical protein [Rhodopseudomonas palustris]
MLVCAPDRRGRGVAATGKRPDGMLSERDIVRELGRRGPACLDTVEIGSMTVRRS